MPELILDVSIVSPRLGDLPLPDKSSSTHPAGVGGIGPNVDIWPGRRVGGDTTRSADRVMLCDLDAGGGPGGGGGNGIPGSHLVEDELRERDDEGVLIAPVDAALREAGGRESACCDPASSDEGASIEIGAGRRTKLSLLISGAARGGSGAGRLANEAMLNKDDGLSDEPALVREIGGGGGGKTGFDAGSGDDRYRFAGETRVAGDIPLDGSSAAIIDVRLLRGGE